MGEGERLRVPAATAEGESRLRAEAAEGGARGPRPLHEPHAVQGVDLHASVGLRQRHLDVDLPDRGVGVNSISRTGMRAFSFIARGMNLGIYLVYTLCLFALFFCGRDGVVVSPGRVDRLSVGLVRFFPIQLNE